MISSSPFSTSPSPVVLLLASLWFLFLGSSALAVVTGGGEGGGGGGGGGGNESQGDVTERHTERRCATFSLPKDDIKFYEHLDSFLESRNAGDNMKASTSFCDGEEEAVRDDLGVVKEILLRMRSGDEETRLEREEMTLELKRVTRELEEMTRTMRDHGGVLSELKRSGEEGKELKERWNEEKEESVKEKQEILNDNERLKMEMQGISKENEKLKKMQEKWKNEREIWEKKKQELEQKNEELEKEKEEARNKVEKINKEKKEIGKKYEELKKEASKQLHDSQDCADLLAKGESKSGVYVIHPPSGVPVSVFCDMQTDGGGWTLFLARMNQSKQLDFNRKWEDYKNGFGSPESEYWLGNENLHRLTSVRNYSVRMEAEDYKGSATWGEWKTFKVDSESSRYKLKIGDYKKESVAGSRVLSFSSGGKFSTIDEDNDAWDDGECSALYASGWWYKHCSFIFPTGIHGRKSWSGIRLREWTHSDSRTSHYVHSLQLKIRPVK